MQARLANCYRSTLGQAMVSAVLLIASLPPFDLWPLAWIAPLWWVLLIRRQRLVGRRPYWSILAAGFLFWAAAVHWLRLPDPWTYLAWIAGAFYLALYLPLFVGLSRVAVHRLQVPVILAAPIVWTGLELLRGRLFGGFTMASLGHTQYRWLGVIQLSDLAGAYGVSFLVMFVAACLARMVPQDRPRAYWPAPLALGVLGGCLLYGHWRMESPSEDPAAGPKTRIALVQGSIDITLHPPPDRSSRMRRQYHRLSTQAVAEYGELDLLVWPETVFGETVYTRGENAQVPEDWTEPPEEFWPRLAECNQRHDEITGRMVAEYGSALLIGANRIEYRAHGVRLHNSAFFVPRHSGLRQLPYYDKMSLVMFGEYFPFADRLTWLYDFTPVSSLGTGATPGESAVAYDVNGLLVSPNICYESVIPHVIRRQVLDLRKRGREPDVLINLTNDGWFWGSSELDMHLACGVFRAVECRKPFLIAANTGFSAWIDGNGRIVAQGPRRATGTILAEVGPDLRDSWYLRHGDWLAGLCLLGCLVCAVVGAWGRFAGSSGS